MIAATAIITIGTQVYRSVQNYELNKERFINEMQQSLDVSLESYFADLTRSQLEVQVFDDSDSVNSNVIFQGAWSSNSPKEGIKRALGYLSNHDSTNAVKRHFFESKTSAIIIDSAVNPSMIESIDVASFISSSDSGLKPERFSKKMEIELLDSLERLKGFAQKIVLSLSDREVDLDSLNNYLNKELARRDMSVNHVLVLYRNSMGPIEVRVESDGNRMFVFKEKPDTVYSKAGFHESDLPLKVFSKNTFLSKDQKIAVQFENASLNILKRGGVDLFISLLITTAVIGAMMYLYGIISEQKQLAEIKNDLISNITHEFKTPIATISTAMEGISNFNQMNDPEKTAKYVGISQGQLKKLNGMVEKLLETASLDSNELEISKEEVEIVSFTRQVFEKFNLIKGEKELVFETDLSEVWLSLDPFHMENAIGNLVDNALKYGGSRVLLKLSESNGYIVWQVQDNGGGINKQEQQRIFDKFYRIPTGNVHNVKGFGIGLYYTKTLVEKHGGIVSLSVNPNSTLFTIELKNGKA